MKIILFRLTTVITAFMLLFAVPTRTLAWGKDGHLIVAHIAVKLLTPQAADQVNKILSPHSETLESVAVWADTIRGGGDRPYRAETPRWHFVDIPLKGKYDPKRDCLETPNGSCVVSALVMFQDVLTRVKKGYYTEDVNRYEALKFIVHFAGDVHQPLHCIDDNDSGGNSKNVFWLNGKTNFHHVWDNDILIANMKAENIKDDAAFADFLFGKLTAAEINSAKPSTSATPTTVSRGDIEDWAKDSHKIADQAYSDLGKPDENMFYNLDAEDGRYYKKYKDTVNRQLMLAGLRLARILNENLR